jgi:hypothetical protein
MNIGAGCLTESLRVLTAAVTLMTPAIKTTAVGVSGCMNLGSMIAGRFFNTSQLYRAGITLSSTWIGQTLTEGMNLVISDLLLGQKTHSINVPSSPCKNESPNLSNVYDIVNAGPRQRFTVRTSSGHLIVHNSGFGGWTGSWKAFGAEEALGDDAAIKKAILAWRAASPNIVEMWGGQYRGLPWKSDYRWEPFGLEGMAVLAVMHPGEIHSYRGISYQIRNDVLFCTLLSGRSISYHAPRLTPTTRPNQKGYTLSFEGWNSNPKMGPIGWVRLETYSGKLFENVVQATARDIMRDAAIRCEQHGYQVLLRVHDELVTQKPHGQGTVEELEAILSLMPTWAQGWPIRAAGGWEGSRYRKD